MKLAITIVPPGRQTRCSSRATACWSAAKIAPNAEVTTSNSPSANGSASASASTHSTDRPPAARRPASRLSGVRSEATTSAPASAARSATLPVPAATSSTRMPGRTPAASISTGPTLHTSWVANRW